MQDLQIYWPLDTVWTEYLARPVAYVSHLLGYEVRRVSCVPPCWMQVLTWMGCLRARMCLPVCLCVGGCGCGCVTPWVWLWLSQGSGSLLTYLKSQHLADGVSTSMEVDSRGFAIFVVDVSLTPFVGNDADKVDEVVAAVYGFLNLVRMVWQPLLHQIFRLRWSLMRPHRLCRCVRCVCSPAVCQSAFGRKTKPLQRCVAVCWSVGIRRPTVVVYFRSASGSKRSRLRPPLRVAWLDPCMYVVVFRTVLVHAASNLLCVQRVPPRLLLNPPSAWEWSPQDIRHVLDQLTPTNMLLFFVSSAIPTASLTQTEPIYGTKWVSTWLCCVCCRYPLKSLCLGRYLASDVSPAKLAAWAGAAVNAAFHLPTANPFVSSNFDIIPPPPPAIASNSTPQMVLNDEAKTRRVWWLQDVMFHVRNVP